MAKDAGGTLYQEQLGWEVVGEVCLLHSAHRHQLALFQVELEPEGRRFLTEPRKRTSHHWDVPCQDTVVLVEHVQVQAVAKVSRNRLQCSSEKQRSEGVTLLHPARGRHSGGAKLQRGGGTIAPPHPPCEAREVVSGGAKDCFPADSVERILEVQLNEHLVAGLGVRLGPRAHRVHSDLCPRWHSDPHLNGPEEGAGFLTNCRHEALAGQPAENLAYGDCGLGTATSVAPAKTASDSSKLYFPARH